MGIARFDTAAAAAAFLAEHGFAPVAAEILPRSWRASRYFFNPASLAAGCVWPERAGWVAGNFLASDPASRALARRVAGAAAGSPAPLAGPGAASHS